MHFTLNGQPVDVAPRDGQSLLELLREELELRSMKDGCAPEGSCGACTVLIDGRAVVSCAQKATRVEGKHVVTHEGLPTETRKLWADCFAVAGASQCGFCSPGIVMKAEGLLAKNPEPGRDDVAHALLGNLCRCTGYVKVIDAVLLAAGARRGEPLPEPGGDGVGERALRYRADELALGDKPFAADLTEPGMLHGALRFSDHPRARVLRIDTAKAAAHPGVIAVLTADDVPGRRMLGSLKQDWRQLVAVGETTSYVGDVIACVAADTRHAAREAAELVEVEYEVLEPVTNPSAALAVDAPLLHPDGNILSTSTVQRGDVDRALESAAHVVSRSFRTQFIEHAFLEPEAALAVPSSDEPLRVYSQGQGVWDDRRQIAQFLDVPDERVRVTQVSSGGAFGAKEDLNVQGHAALLAVRTERPVLLVLSRKESLRFHAKRHAMWLDYTVACDANGRLLAVRAHIVGDTGAYASVGDKVLERAAGHACSAYRVDNVDVEATAVYTNNPPCGAMRGFGVNQSNFAMEGVLDELAELVGIDGWEIRYRNALDTGDRTTTGQLLGPGVGLKRTLRAVKDAYRNAPLAGIACGLKNTGIGNGVPEHGRAILRPEADGSITLYHSETRRPLGTGGRPERRGCDRGRPRRHCVGLHRVGLDSPHPRRDLDAQRMGCLGHAGLGPLDGRRVGVAECPPAGGRAFRLPGVGADRHRPGCHRHLRANRALGAARLAHREAGSPAQAGRSQPRQQQTVQLPRAAGAHRRAAAPGRAAPAPRAPTRRRPRGRLDRARRAPARDARRAVAEGVRARARTGLRSDARLQARRSRDSRRGVVRSDPSGSVPAGYHTTARTHRATEKEGHGQRIAFRHPGGQGPDAGQARRRARDHEAA